MSRSAGESTILADGDIGTLSSTRVPGLRPGVRGEKSAVLRRGNFGVAGKESDQDGTAGALVPSRVSTPIATQTAKAAPSHDREWPPFRLVEGVERATGIESAWPAWKAALIAPSEASTGDQAGSQCPAIDRG